MLSVRLAGLAALVVLATTACSGGGDSDAKPSATPSHRAPGIHHWTAAPCSFFDGKELIKGFTVSYVTDVDSNVGDSNLQQDIDEDGNHWPYQEATCLMQVLDKQQRTWKLNATARIYEKVGPACAMRELHEAIDLRENRHPETVDKWSYRIGAEDEGDPGRTLEMCNGNARFDVSAYGPIRSERRDIEDTADRLTEKAADILEAGLRDRDA